MKVMSIFAVLMATAFISYGDIAPPESSGLIVTGAWQFVHTDGSITNGTWTHENIDDVHLMSHEPEEYAKQTGKTGLLVMWWDIERKKHQLPESVEFSRWPYLYDSQCATCGLLDRHSPTMWLIF